MLKNGRCVRALRRGQVGRRRVWRGTALLPVVAMLVGTLGSGTAASAFTPTVGSAPCLLVPKLTDVTINQGLGSYNPLARGKDTLVKLYLSLPDCANTSAGDQITVTSPAGTPTSLTATGTASDGSQIPPFTVNMYNQPGFNLGPAVNAPYLNQPADPTFLIPGSLLQPTTTGASFSLSFQATVNFTARPGTGSASTPGTSPTVFSTRPSSTATISATVERKTNALRVLVVKMIDPQNPTPFSTSAQSAVDNGMAELSRVFPLPTGVSTLTSTTGGLRYSFNNSGATGGALNLRSVPQTVNGSTTYYNLVDTVNTSTNRAEFCGSANFSLVASALETYRQGWNAANPTTPADRVLGVVDEADSIGSTTPSTVGCPDGFGGIPTASTAATAAWARACYATCLTPVNTGASITGSLIAMELGHTAGLVPSTRDDGTRHSPNVHADQIPAQAPGRSFYIPNRSVVANASIIGDSHSAMRYASDSVSTWNDTDTLLEQADYGFLLCTLGGTINTECSVLAGTLGTQAGVAAGGLLTLVGSVSASSVAGSAPMARVTDSFASPNQALQTPPDPTSLYHLVQVSGPGGTVCRDDAIPVTTRFDGHDGATVTSTAGADGTIDAAVPYVAGCTNRIELRYTGTNPAAVLYARDTTNGTPQISSASSGPAMPTAGPVSSYLPTAGNSHPEPQLSGDAQSVAFNSGPDGSLHVAVAAANGTVSPVTLSTISSDPAWRYDAGVSPAPAPGQRMLAFVNAPGGPEANGAPSAYGDIFTVAVDTTTPAAIFGTPVRLTSGGLYRDVSWSRDGSSLVAESNGNIVTIPANPGGGFATPQVLLAGGAAGYYFEPSWSHTAGDNRIAVSRVIGGQVDLLTFDPLAANPAASLQLLVQNGQDPSWDDTGLVAFAHGSGTLQNLSLVRSDGTGQVDLTSQVPGPSGGPTDDFASLAGGTVFFDRYTLPYSDTQAGAIVKMTLTPPVGSGVTVTATTSSGTGAGNLRLDLFSQCPTTGSPSSPLVMGLTPFAATASTARFFVNVDPTGGCGGTSGLSAVVNDGLQQSASSPAGSASTGASAPVATIVNPVPGQTFLQYATIPLSGTVRDAVDGELGPSDRWSLTNSTGSVVASGSGPVVEASPPAGGWVPGAYTLTLAGTASSALSGTKSVAITVLADADHDGLADVVEQGSCFPANHDSDPYEPWQDYVGDGVPNIDNPAPCTAIKLYLAQEVFHPTTLSVSSNGTATTVDISLSFNAPLSAVAPTAVQIETIQGQPVTGFASIHWVVTGPNTAVAQFDRKNLVAYLSAHGLINRTVTFEVGGSAPAGWSFDGACFTSVTS